MKRFICRIRKAVVVLGLATFVPQSAWAAVPAFHPSGSAGGSAFRAPSHVVPSGVSSAYVHPASSGGSSAKLASSNLRNLSSSQATVMSRGGSIASATTAGNLVFLHPAKNPSGSTSSLPAGGGHVLGITNATTLRVMDEDPNHLTNGSDGNYQDGEAMPQPVKPRIWSGSSNQASAANVPARSAPKASIVLANGEHVQKYLDGVATASSPAGQLQKGEQIQKQMGSGSNSQTQIMKLTETKKQPTPTTGPAAQLKKGEQIQNQIEKADTQKNSNGPAAKLKKGEQIQKQIEAGANNPQTPNPPQPPNPQPPSTPTPTFPISFPFWSSLGWGYFGGGFGGNAGAADMSGTVPAADPTPVADPAQSVEPATQPATTQQAADSELTLKLGESYTIANENFGTTPGGLSLQLNGLTLAVHVDQWDAGQITFTLPTVGLTKATEGRFQILGTDHQLLKGVSVMVVSADAAR